MKTYKVTNECIACHACVEVANSNFEMGNNKIAFVKKQAKNSIEEEQCDKAVDICPVNAIIIENISKQIQKEPVLASSNIKNVLDKHPHLKDVLVVFSNKFKKLINPVTYNTLARFATFKDAARVTGISICEILHIINKSLGTIDELQNKVPECIKDVNQIDIFEYSQEITWPESNERYIYNTNTISELAEKISKLSKQENIVIIAVLEPLEIIKLAKGLDLIINIEKNKEYRISIFNPQKKTEILPWEERKDQFEVLDVREMTSDPFDIIIKKAYEIKNDNGFVLVQRFEPHPLINMLSEMGFEHISEQKIEGEFWIYFHKILSEEENHETSSSKVDVVIQSATPVAYPVIMRLLQSQKIRDLFNIKELKVWEETEKHLAWITNGKADISFSALITAAKLRNSDIIIPTLFVWDNFVLLSRHKIDKFEDIKGKEIYTPLFEEAPPAKITKYLIKASGLNPNDFKFKFGTPFGRPEEIYSDFVSGKANTVILREPEASYAIKIMQDRKQEISILSFNKIWNEINPGFGSFPNAGLVLKGEFARKYPEQSKVFLDELKLAIQWVNDNRKKSAELSFDLMRQPVDRIELFLDRVNFEYVDGEKLHYKVKQYFDILNKHKIVDVKIDNDFLNIFKIDNI